MLRKDVNEGVTFVHEYYRTFTRNIKHVARFYTEESVLTILKETELHTSHDKNIIQELIDKHHLKVDKVLISALDSHNIGDLLFISLVGQFVYSNNQCVRFSQQFILKNKKILVDNCRLLDEEVIYTPKPNKYKNYLIKVKSEEANDKSNIMQTFSSFGRINSLKQNDNEFL
ncbi:hypothetical protein H311_00445, partial [Anncaliia algerae PRA109]